MNRRPFLAFVPPACLLSGILLAAHSPALAGDAPRPRQTRGAVPGNSASAGARDPLAGRLLPRRAIEPSVPAPASTTDDALLALPRPWRCGKVVAGGRPVPLGIPGYAVYPLSSGDAGTATRYGYCVYPAAAPIPKPR